MKKTWFIIIFSLLSYSLNSQTVESAIKRMNSGQYEIAKSYWEALNNTSNKYANKIKICNICDQLQAEAKQLMSRKRYSKAIDKYLSILDQNPSDKNASAQIDKCKRLRDEYIESHSFQTYTNQYYGYSIKIPTYLNKDTNSNNDAIIYWSVDYKVKVILNAIVEDKELSNKEILNRILPKSYNTTTDVTYRKTKDNWIVVSGHLSDGKIFYEKSFITSRKSQYGDRIKIIVSAAVITSKDDTRGHTIAEAIHKYFKVDTFGQTINVKETDEDRWQRALKSNTKEGYNVYISQATGNSKHKEEAIARKSILEARGYYKNGEYVSAKRKFELGERYLSADDMDMYAYSFYIYCRDYCDSTEELLRFSSKFPNYAQMKVIRGCIVKAYCRRGRFSDAKNYVKKYKNIWYDENTRFSSRQWRRFIRKYKRG